MAGLAITALSQVSLVIGLGSSCSQPLLLNRPSRIDGSSRKAISKPLPAESVRDGGRLRDAIDLHRHGCARSGALWEMTPSLQPLPPVPLEFRASPRPVRFSWSRMPTG